MPTKTFILIDPFEQSVREIDRPENGKLYDMIAPPPMMRQDGELVSVQPGCGLFTFAYGEQCQIMVDDEGLYTEWPAFRTSLYPFQALSGRALLCDVENGETIPAAVTLDEARASVTWGAVPAEPRFEILTGDAALRAMGWLP